MSSAHAPTQVADALAYLRENQAGLLADVVRAERVLWVGSGVSRGQVLPLEDLLDKLIRFLQAEMKAADESDGHFAALREITEAFFAEKVADFLEDPVNWRPERAALEAAVSSYSDILATEVPGKSDDYLLWDGIDIRETYGAPDIAPGPEHDLIAILIRERVVDALVTTNWDGLIERASRLAACADDQGTLAVHMTNESFQTERGDAQLNKIHGCAVLAREDPDAYRQYLVARIADIALWHSATIYSFIVARIESLLQSRRSVFLGLSVQDYNLLALIANATTVQPWSWNKTNPSYVFAAKELGQRQREFLNIAYRGEPVAKRLEIRRSSSLTMYSGPTLASFVVETMRRKLEVGLARAADYNSVDDVVQSLSTGLEELEKALLERVGSELDVLVKALKQGLSPLLLRYYDPTAAQEEGSYYPLFPATVPACSTAAEFKNLSLPELTVALCLVGLGRAHGIWEPLLVTNDSPVAGTIVLRSKATGRRVRLVITRDEVATSAFKATDVWREGLGSVVLMQATGQRVVPSVRGLSRGIGSGRSVGSTRRQSWLTDLHPAVGAPSDMMAAFRAEVAL